MNKKIYRGYELIEAIANKKIKDYTKIIPHYPNNDCTVEYFEYSNGFIHDDKYSNDVNVCIFLNNDRTFEILEDNTEEIEELDLTKDEEKKAIDKLKAGEKIGIYELIRTFKREGIENFVITRKKYVDTVLNLIDNQQKEIERLEARRYMYNAETGEISQIPLNNNYISKDKIKAKIEEYDKKKKDIPHEIDLKAFYTITDIRNIQIDVLKALLEEE